MKKVKKYWMVVLLAGLLVATLVGVAGARPNQSGQAGALSRRITIPAGHFIPADDDELYSNEGGYIQSGGDASLQEFYAPVVFPTGQAVVVESVTLYAYDNNAFADLCLSLHRTDVTGGMISGQMSDVCSTGLSTSTRHFTDSSIIYNPVKHGNGVYLLLQFQDDTSMWFTAARIQYHHGTT
jgi:hypothetical protein